jgi:hypothetical protein
VSNTILIYDVIGLVTMPEVGLILAGRNVESGTIVSVVSEWRVSLFHDKNFIPNFTPSGIPFVAVIFILAFTILLVKS